MKIIITSVADKKSAKKLANELVSAKFAACVSVLKAQSFYFWQDKICDEKERILLIKTQAKFKDVSEFIRSNHEYKLPEIIALKPHKVEKSYKKWIKKESK